MIAILLIVLILAVILSPSLPRIFNYIKQKSFKDFEAELRDMLKEAARATRQARKGLAESQRELVPQDITLLDDGESKAGPTDPYSDVLWCYGEIERAIKNRLTEHGLTEPGGDISWYRLITIARDNKILPQKILSSVSKFGGIRNKLAYGNLEEVDESTLREAALLGKENLGMVLAMAETTGQKKENHE